MSLSDSEISFAIELFSPLGALTSRKLFGGLALYHDGIVFSLISGSGQIFLKAKGRFADTLAGQGSTRFGGARGRLMPYWTLPDAALDDPDAASNWARRALAALD